MRTLKRAGASLLALGVAAAGMVMAAPMASAHTGTLTTKSVCQDNGTYQITYTGTTTRVPQNGPGHTATLTVGEVQPVNAPITDAPATVVGNTTYSFHETVPGSATYAQATAFLAWGDGAKADPIGKANLSGNCTGHAHPSGDLSTDCVNGGGHVVASKLDNGSANNVTWRLVSGTDASHTTVVAGPTAGTSLEASGLPDVTKVWLQFNVGSSGWVDEGSVVTTGHCKPVVVPPTGSFTVVCSDTGANVTIGDLSPGSRHGVVWTLTYGTQSKTVDSHDVVAVPASAHLALSFRTANGDTKVVQEGTAPEACAVVVPPSGSFTVVCSDTGANVTIGDLSPGSRHGVVWTLTYGTQSKTVTSHEVVAVPASVPLALSFITANGDSKTVQSDTAPAACAPVVPPAGAFTVVCSATGANVTIGTLTPGTSSNVVWTLTYGSASKTVGSGDVVAVPALAALTLSFKSGGGNSTPVQSGTAPALCNRTLDIVKSVDSAGPVDFGETLTYTLLVTAGGTLGETSVVVSDYIPGHNPDKASGLTTYVDGSAKCADAGTCTPSYNSTTNLLTWGLGDMAAGTTRTVTFQVTVDEPVNSLSDAAETDIFNVAAVGSTEAGTLPSNVVKTTVAAVQGVKKGHKPGSGNGSQPTTGVLGTSLPHTGAPGHLPWTLGAAALFLLMGSALIFLARKPEGIRVR